MGLPGSSVRRGKAAKSRRLAAHKLYLVPPLSLKGPVGDDYVGPYLRHQFARLYMMSGERDKTLDLLEPLLPTPYYLLPG